MYFTTWSSCDHLGISVKGARVVVQGFGNAGSAAAHLLDSALAVVAGASDSKVAPYNRHRLDIPKLIMHEERTGSLKGFPAASPSATSSGCRTKTTSSGMSRM